MALTSTLYKTNFKWIDIESFAPTSNYIIDWSFFPSLAQEVLGKGFFACSGVFRRGLEGVLLSELISR
jgi:hypothetical protein